jgi:Spy/CpxP family protein refolding chaperone
MRNNRLVFALFAALVFFATISSVYAQAEQQQAAAQQNGAIVDPIRQLNLTPEQREKIRSIREQTKAERVAITERIRETNRALEEILDADNPDEAVVEQQVRDAAAAQAAAMRMRILTEVRIRRVLTPEQIRMLRVFRQQARGLKQDQLRNEREQQRRPGIDGSGTFQNQRDGAGPLFPRRGQRRARP